ncbi:hypothetical protein DNTS_027311 [Danionella cerebrum]|uniref:Uncharacterized protein n=1 Tax=Danionella cerebrum TaxID=2873325 RepID=A0A553QVT4_9TELE|nr:hypothetical protein DNTS_027311 [Danionella translucida]TRY94079.1 hypothetical protein DNTS_027311 [Danionella translucida]
MKALSLGQVTYLANQRSSSLTQHRNCRLVTGANRCRAETVTNGEDRMQSSQLVFSSLIESCTYMAFVSVSGDFCQAQHLLIVDK